MSDSNLPKSNEKPALPNPSPGESAGAQRDIQTPSEETSTSELRNMLDDMRAMVLAQLKDSKDSHILKMINHYTDGAYAPEYSEKHVEKPLALAELDRTPATNLTATQTPTSSEPRDPFWETHQQEMKELGGLMDRLFDLQVSQLTPTGEMKTLPTPHTTASATDALHAFPMTKMAEPASTNTGGQSDGVAHPAKLSPTPQTQMENAMSESIQPTTDNKPAISAPNDPIRQILTKLLENANQIPEQYKELGIRIRDLGIAGKDPAQLGQNIFQLKIASALGDFEYVTKGQLDLSAEQRAAAQLAQTRRLTEPAIGSDGSSAPKNGGEAKPPPETQPPVDPIRDVLTKLIANISQLPDSAKDLRKTIQALDDAAQEPIRFNQRSVQHKVAYATEDFEKATGKALDFAPAQRAEVTKLAGNAPGLENERMLDLLRSTPRIGDSKIIQDIRRTAYEIGKQANQSTPETQSQIEQLENRVRQAARAAETANEARAGDAPPKAEQAPSPGNHAANGSRNDQQRAPNAPDQRGAQNGANTQQVPGMQTAVLRGGILDTLTAVLRGNGQPNNAPWDPAPTPLGTRLQAFEAKVAARQQDEGIERVQNWARAAANAMDLRQAFDKALIDDKGFGAAYDKAATALARYGSGREKVEQIIAKRPDAANLAAKFEQLDGEIGEKASSIPSRNQGKNMLDDISTTIAEILQRAADKVRAIFRPGPTVSPSASPAA